MPRQTDTSHPLLHFSCAPFSAVLEEDPKDAAAILALRYLRYLNDPNADSPRGSEQSRGSDSDSGSDSEDRTESGSESDSENDRE